MLRPYQKQGIRWLWARTSGLLADEQGLGKTVQAAFTIYPGSVVVCPASVVRNWRSELKVWRPDLQVTLDASCANAHNVLVISYAKLDKVQHLVQVHTIIADEAHYLKSPTTTRSKLFAQLVQKAQRLFLLTGTPIPDRPRDLWVPMRLIGATGLSYRDFTRAFAAGREQKVTRYFRGRKFEKTIWNDSGASSLTILKQMMQPHMLRRLKRDVLPELPEKVYQVVPLSTYVKWDERENAHKALVRTRAVRTKLLLEKHSSMRLELGLSKLPHVVEYTKDWLEGNEHEKLVILAHHNAVIDTLANELFDYGRTVLTGASTQRQRSEAVYYFQHNNKYRVFIGNMRAAGVGITLTAASTLMFAELDWTPGTMDQGADRIHRIGQRHSVSIQFLVADGGIEHNLIAAYLAKSRNIAALLDEV